jgi:hypothetical protein
MNLAFSPFAAEVWRLNGRTGRPGHVKLVSGLVAAKIGGRDRCIVIVQGTPGMYGRSALGSTTQQESTINAGRSGMG